MGSKTAYATSTNTSEPWAEQKPFLTEIMGKAQDLYKNHNPQFFPGSTVAGFSPQQEQAFGMAANRATQGNATMKAAEGYTQDVLGGQYSGDPYQSQVFQNMQSQIMPAVNANFSSAGRYGSGAHTDSMTRALTESFAPYATQMYQQGLNRMDNAAQQAGQFAQNDYTDIAALADVGAQRRALAQDEIGDAQARFDFQQDLPYNKLQQYLGTVGGNYGGQSTSTTPYQKPGLLSQVGGGILGLAGLFG